jgi:hypothetical protein
MDCAAISSHKKKDTARITLFTHNICFVSSLNKPTANCTAAKYQPKKTKKEFPYLPHLELFLTPLSLFFLSLAAAP